VKPLVLATILLAGCSQANEAKPETEIEVRPVGRFQMLPATDDSEDIIVLDTRYGVLRRCWFKPKDELNLMCGHPSDVLD